MGACAEPMWVEEKGTSADPADTSIVCGCSRDFPFRRPSSLDASACAGASDPGFSTATRTVVPKAEAADPTATNTYFPQVHTVISLPTEEDALTNIVERSPAISAVENVADVKGLRNSIRRSAALSEPMPMPIFSRASDGCARAQARMRQVAEDSGVRYFCERARHNRHEPRHRKTLCRDPAA